MKHFFILYKMRRKKILSECFFLLISPLQFFLFHLWGNYSVFFKKTHGNVIVFHLFFQERLFVLDQWDTHENKGIYLVFQFLVSKKQLHPQAHSYGLLKAYVFFKIYKNIRAFNKQCSCACVCKYFLRSTSQKSRFIPSFSCVCPCSTTNLLCYAFE